MLVLSRTLAGTAGELRSSPESALCARLVSVSVPHPCYDDDDINFVCKAFISVSVPHPCYDDDDINFVCKAFISVSVPPPCHDVFKTCLGIRSTPVL